MKQLNLAIIVPFYNESKNLVYFINEWENLLSSKKQIRDSLFFFFVNDGSTDDSVKNIKKKIKKLNYYIVNKRNSGHGDSCRFGYSFVANNYKKFNYVMQIDSDNQCDPKYLIQFYNLIKINKEDFVFGYRKFREDGYSRLLISRLLAITTFIKKFIYVKDLNTPYRLMKTSKLKQTLINIKNKKVYDNIQLFNCILSYEIQKNYKINWININFRKRRYGKSKFNLLKMFMMYLNFFLKI